MPAPPFPTPDGATNRGRNPVRGFYFGGFRRRSALGTAAGPVGVEGAAPCGESTGLDRLPHLLREVEVEKQVVDGVEPRAEDLVRAMQVVQVGAREVAACVAAAGGIEGPGV